MKGNTYFFLGILLSLKTHSYGPSSPFMHPAPYTNVPVYTYNVHAPYIQTYIRSFSYKKSQRHIRTLKILCAFDYCPIRSQIYALNQITGLINRGHSVDLYAHIHKEIQPHPQVLTYNLEKQTYYGELPPNINSYDIILCQFGQLGNYFIDIKKNLGIKAKIVTCFRGSDVTKMVLVHGPHFYDNLFNQGDLFLPVCDYFKTILIDLGCDPHKIKVHYSAIDLNYFTFTPYKQPEPFIRIASINRLAEQKGMIYSIEAIAQLLKKYPNIRYTIMGDGILKDTLEKLIKEKKIDHAVRLVGWGMPQKVLNLLKNSDIFVLPSITDKEGIQEGIPNALKEAMAVGVPVISTLHAGIKELIENGKTGYLVECANSEHIVQTIEYLIQNPHIGARMKIAARAHVEQTYDTEKLNDTLENFFYQLIS